MNDLIGELTQIHGPSGNEEWVREAIRALIEPHANQVWTDALGNLIASAGREGGTRVMLSAHMDEVGVMVTHVDEEGFLRFDRVGSINPYFLPGRRVVFANGTVGTIGTERLDSIKDLEVSRLFIDIGARNRSSALEKVRVGDLATFWGPVHNMGDTILAKSLDDRIGCAVLVQTLKELQETPNLVFFVFTVQEEVGIRGARTAAYGLDPEVGIAVDVTATGDTPKARRLEVSVGKGVAVKIKDRSVMTHPAVKKLLVDAAEEQGIPYQFEVLEFGGTDAGAIHLTREGVPSGVLSIPVRYVHSPSEMASLEDAENCVRLLKQVLSRPIRLD